MAISAEGYFQANPDVAAAYAANSYGLTPEQFAQTHYTNFGAAEGRYLPTEAVTYAEPVAQTPAAPATSLADQILGSSNNSAWTGEGFGSARANAEDMAKVLGRAGISDVSQLGVRSVEVPATYAYGESGEGILVSAPTTNQEYFNKSTGQPVEASYDRAGGNIFSGTFKGKDSTSYGVQFDANGNPQFYTQQGADTSDMGSIAPFLAIGALALGLGGGFEGLFGSGAAGAAGAAGLTAEQLALMNALGGAEVAGGLTAVGASAAGLGGGFGALTGLTAAQIAALEGLGGAEVAGGLTAEAAGAAGLGGGFTGATTGLLGGMTAEQLAAMEGLGGAEVAGGLTAAEAGAAGLGGGFTGVAGAAGAAGLTAEQLAAVNGLGGAEVAGGLTAAEAGAAGLGGGFTGAATGALSGLTTSQISNLIRAGVGLVGAGGVASVAGGGGSNVPFVAPTQQVPQNNAAYYNQLQQYYNGYLPQSPRDVVTPLQQWYNSSYGA